MDLSNSGATLTVAANPVVADARPPSTLSMSPSPSPSQESKPTNNTSVPLAANQMYSKNANGTVVLTTIPGNDAELQLYRVMQRASLLLYYDTLLEMGGDDVQQLCDAGEEEFLEIMALVGMASKPLHVRRFQKSLQEWIIDPGAFQMPLASPSSSSSSGTLECCSRRSILDTNSRPIYSPSPGETSPAASASRSSGSRSSSPLTTDVILSEATTRRLRAAAERLASRLQNLQPKTPAKRRMGRELDAVLALPDTDQRRMDAIRRYAAIYGRFDCKRRPEKPLTLHEASVNEAAAQLCHFVPALLTRRDKLFPLARQLVRDSGTSYVYPATPVLTTSSATVTYGKQSSRRRSNDDDMEDEPASKKSAITDNRNA